MPLRPLPYREVKRKLEAAGFVEVSQKGSHIKFAKQLEQGLRTATVPKHREIPVGTIRSILRQAGIDIEEFESL
ncbi:MAG: type II toxin-antitoxin system HicA family toxin [Chloroflexota bacterium]|nr:type II toxin-antitoxin system HicA family toxin [Chloroflexota bacterium]